MLLKIKAGVPRTMDNADNPTFEVWMSRVDRFVQRAAGVSLDDLPDCQYDEWYEDRLRPIRAAQRALRNAGDLD